MAKTRLISVDENFKLPSVVMGGINSETIAIVEENIDPLWDTLNGAPQTITFDQFPIPASGLQQFNTATIAQDTITTAPNGDVYAVYWDSNREPRIVAKPASLGTYITASLAYVANNPLASPVTIDSHNNIVIGIDGDGYIHVSGNHHGQALRYMRSQNPYDISSWIQGEMIGSNENSVTYPQFVRTNTGDLLFFHRNGVSGSGDHYLNKYNRTTKTWARVCSLFKGTAPVTPDQSAYINRVAKGADGSLHLFYMWREEMDANSNTDLSYIKSTDNGTTWKSVDGTTLTLPITPTQTSGRIITGNPGGLVNQSGSSVDSNGVPHTFFWLTAASGSSSKQLNHIYWTGSEWKTEPVAASGSGISRATGYSTSDGRTYAIFKRNGFPTALRVSPTLGTEITLYPFNQATWEPTYDAEAPANTLRLSIAPANAENSNYASTYAGILTVDMSKIENTSSRSLINRPRSTAVPENNTPVTGTPMKSGKFYSPAGIRSAADGSTPDGDFRGVIYTAAEAGAINKLSVNIVGRAGITGLTRLAAYSLDGELLAVSNPIDTSTTGIKTADVLFRVGKGRSFVVGAITQGSTSPSYTWLDGTHDYRIPLGSATSSFATYAGVSASGITGDLPKKLTLSGTTKVPVTTIGIY